MIEIRDKKDCVGCNACAQRCPMGCISFTMDEYGFSYPIVSKEECIDCGLCETVCPVLHQDIAYVDVEAYAGLNKDRLIELSSSSGGIFYPIAKHILDSGGVVFGAKFDERWGVHHSYTTNLYDLRDFLTSKYVQSRIEDSYKDAERFLKEGNLVLFSGTPCQIKGLKLFLMKEYSNLYCIDVICHGVPAPKLWDSYLIKLLNKIYGKDMIQCMKESDHADELTLIKGINFRDKQNGWEKFGFSCIYDSNPKVANGIGMSLKDAKASMENKAQLKKFYQPFYKNLYMRIFLKDYSLRPSCFACPAKCGKSLSDVTLGDFWGIRSLYPKLYEDGFKSLVLVNSKRGAEILGKLETVSLNGIDYEVALQCNPAIEESAHEPKEYYQFRELYVTEGIEGCEQFIMRHTPNKITGLFSRGKRYIRRLISKT